MQNIPIKVNEATAAKRRISMWLVDGTDGITPKTGQTGNVRVSKNGGASAASTNTIVEVDSVNMQGLYYIELAAAEVDTVGPLLLSFKTGATAQWHETLAVVSYDPYNAASLGLSRIDINTSAVWDELVANHTVAASFGEQLQPIRRNTAQSGAVGSINLDAGASAIDNYYSDCLIYIVAGAGAGQGRLIVSYLGASKKASVSPNWSTTPDNTSKFIIFPAGQVDVGAFGNNAIQMDVALPKVSAWQVQASAIANAVWDEFVSLHANGSTQMTFGAIHGGILNGTAVAGGASTITLPGSASAVDDFYKGYLIFIAPNKFDAVPSQARLITSYVGATQVATVAPAWNTVPDNNTTFVILPSGRVNLGTWLESTPNALIAGRVDANAQVVGDKTGYSLTAAERTAIANALLDLAAAVDTHTLREIFRIVAAYCGGKSSGGANDDNIRSIDDAKARITATLDANGHRTAVTLDFS